MEKIKKKYSKTDGLILGIGFLTGQEVIFIVFDCFYFIHN